MLTSLPETSVLGWPEMKIGDRVEMTEAAIARTLQGRANRRIGVVVGIKNFDQIRVLRDGCKRSECFHVTFWKKVIS